MARSIPVPTAAPFLPTEITIPALQRAAAACTGCDLYKNATQTVFGEGPETARLMLVGEVPGDKEDRLGHPFVGPAGQLLDRCLLEVGIDRAQTYVTNAVKHFKWEPRGKRRIHVKPNAMEIRACHPWLEAEIEALAPEVLVCLGATAAQALLGPDFRVTRDRGRFIQSRIAPYVTATVHPSALLRAPPEQQEEEIGRFIADLRKVAEVLNKGG